MALAFGDFVFDPVRCELRKAGLLLKVDAKQLDLLACFLSHPGQVLTKEALLDEVWEGRAVADSALSVAAAKLRKVLGDLPSEPGFIENRYGRGYRFLAPVTQLAAAAETDQVASAQASAPVPVSGDIFVGRADAMARLESAFARLHKGEGSISALIGEPGIGKTRLA